MDVVFAGLVARDWLTITEFVGTDYFGARDTDWRQLQAVTVKSYMRSVLAKLGAGNRVGAIAIARRHGLIP